MLHRYGCIGCILNADIRSTRGFTTDVIIPKYKFGCIQYRRMYNILGGFITMCFADIFSDGSNFKKAYCLILCPDFDIQSTPVAKAFSKMSREQPSDHESHIRRHLLETVPAIVAHSSA